MTAWLGLITIALTSGFFVKKIYKQLMRREARRVRGEARRVYSEIENEMRKRRRRRRRRERVPQS